MRHTLLAVLTTLAILVTSNHLGFAQTNSANSLKAKQTKAEKLKKKVEKIGIGGKITAVRLDGRDFYSTINDIEEEDFEMIEVDSKRTVNLKYAELKKIHKGDGKRNLITGKRNNPQRGWLYGLAIFGTLAV
jgi:hypothetical protein